MSDSEKMAPAHTAYGGIAIVNVVAWLLALLLVHFVPEHISTAVAAAAVLSGAIGGGWAAANSLRNAGLMALVGMVSAILLLSLFVPFTGFRVGTAVGGIGTSLYAILSITGFYTVMFLFIFAIESAVSWLGRRWSMQKPERN